MGALTIGRELDVAVVTFDLPDEPVNKFTDAVIEEFDATFERLGTDTSVSAIVVLSGKRDIFIAGADIEGFVSIQTREEAEAVSREGQAVLNRIADSTKPIVAGIHGACLGGGLEFALAAHYRVATDDQKTQLGLPEVQLGLIPGLGGCQRLPRLIGLRAALDLILTGKSARSQKALRLGLVDELVPQLSLRETAIRAARRLAQGERTKKRRPGLWDLVLDRNPLGRRIVFSQARKTTLRQTKGHYPAPLAAIGAVEHGLRHGLTEGLKREAQLFADLAVSDVSRKLVQLFFATTSLKKDSGVDVDPDAIRDVDRVGVVGAGFMGAAIGAVAVTRAKADVRFRDTDADRVARGVSHARGHLEQARRRRRLASYDVDRLSAMVAGGVDYAGFEERDLIIEAVFEDLEVKRKVVAELEEVVPDTCVIASNTSTIPITQIQAQATHPERVLGVHFFSPAEKMPLLEVIPGSHTASWATATAVKFGRAMGKTVIVLRDSPGFWVNRILAPYINEAAWLLVEGTSIEAIDRAMTRFGFPVGPMTLIDEVGIDIAEKTSKVFHDAFGARLAPPPVVDKLVKAGRLGRKAGKGFYRYTKGKKGKVDRAVYDVLDVRPNRDPELGDIEARLMAAMLNEAVRAVSESVVRKPRDGDIGAIFGFGFPPFRGGPLRYIDDLGPEKLLTDLERFASRHGDRFAPAERLVEMARTGQRFYK